MRSEPLDAIRGLAVLMVIACHYFDFDRGMGRLDELFGGVLLACYMRGYCRSATAWGVLACVPPLCDLVYLVTTGPFSCLSITALFCCVIVWSAANMKRPLSPEQEK